MQNLLLAMTICAFMCSIQIFKSVLLNIVAIQFFAYVWIWKSMRSPGDNVALWYSLFFSVTFPFLVIDYHGVRAKWLELGYSPLGLWTLPVVASYSVPSVSFWNYLRIGHVLSGPKFILRSFLEFAIVSPTVAAFLAYLLL